MSVHIVLEKLGQIPSQRLEFRPPVRIGVPTPGYHSEQLASTVRRPLQSITVLHVPHHFPCRHVRVRCRTQGDNLPHQDPKAPHVRFGGEEGVDQRLGRHPPYRQRVSAMSRLDHLSIPVRESGHTEVSDLA